MQQREVLFYRFTISKLMFNWWELTSELSANELIRTIIWIKDLPLTNNFAASSPWRQLPTDRMLWLIFAATATNPSPAKDGNLRRIFIVSQRRLFVLCFCLHLLTLRPLCLIIRQLPAFLLPFVYDIVGSFVSRNELQHVIFLLVPFIKGGIMRPSINVPIEGEALVDLRE